MDLRKEIKVLVTSFSFFIFFYLFPYPDRILQGLKEGALLLNWYVKEHVIYCLIPAFFIAGAISTFISKEAVFKWLGPTAPKPIAFIVASISGTILAVCSCTVLPLFAGLYLQGAGIGPASTFLYSGPAINVLAIVLTGKVLGFNMGLARAIGSISMGILVGLIMHLLFRASERKRVENLTTQPLKKGLSLSKSILFLISLILILLIATSKLIYKWYILYLLFIGLLFQFYFFFKLSWIKLLIVFAIISLIAYLIPYKEIPFLTGTFIISYLANSSKGLLREWFENSYILAKQIFPLLLIGVFISGFFLGGISGEGYIPKIYIESFLGGRDFITHLVSAMVTALMYFATLTEIPIIQGLMSHGVKTGPALAMLLAGPALSLPSLLVLKSIIGPKKTLFYALLVVFFSAIYGYIYEIMMS